jgi:hypothetical protein
MAFNVAGQIDRARKLRERMRESQLLKLLDRRDTAPQKAQWFFFRNQQSNKAYGETKCIPLSHTRYVAAPGYIVCGKNQHLLLQYEL